MLFVRIIPGTPTEDLIPITEDEMLKLAHKDLSDFKIDITKDDYDEQHNGAFHKLDKIFVVEDRKSITESWFVEKYIVGQVRLETKYGCYAMGIDRKLTSEELKLESLYDDLNIRFEDSDAERNIGRNDDKPGLIQRLKTKINFDIYDFPNEQRSRLKLLHLLYVFERENNVELIVFLTKPSLENVDNIMAADYTKNGYLMSKLKRNLVKEIDSDFVFELNQTIVRVVTEWEGQLQKVMFNLDTLLTRESGEDLIRSHNLIMNLIEGIEDVKKYGVYKHSLLETFYLKLAEHESLGREFDIMDITNQTKDFGLELPEDLSLYHKLAGEKVYKKDLDLFLTDNRKELAKLIFERQNVDSNQYKKYDFAASKIQLYLDMLNENTAVGNFIDLPQLLIVAAMQEIIRLNKSELIDNRFYRYKSADKRTLNSELNYGANAFRKSKLAWIGRVNSRYNAYNGRAKEALWARETENAIDKIMVKIFQTNNLPDMIFLHNHYMMQLNAILLSTKQMMESVRRFEKVVARRKKGYSVGNTEDFSTRMFFSATYNSDVLDQLGKRISQWIGKAEREKRAINPFHPIGLIDNYYSGSDEYIVYFRVDPQCKKIFVLRFEMELDSVKEKILVENGVIWGE